MSHAMPLFDQPTTDDKLRHGKQAKAILALMSDGQWRTLDTIRGTLFTQGIGGTTQGVASRLRDFRRPQYGGYTLDKRRVGPGLFEYRLTK